MSSSPITYENVAQAADHLVSRHESPTIRAVRLVLGRGSFGTIARHLGAWRNSRQGTPSAEEISPAFRAALVAEIARHVQKMANGKEEELRTLVQEREELLTDNERLEREKNTLASRIETMRAEEIRREEQIRLLGTQLEEERTRSATLTTRLHEVEKSLVRLEVRLEAAEKRKAPKISSPKSPSSSGRSKKKPSPSPTLTKPAKFMTLGDDIHPAPAPDKAPNQTEKVDQVR